MEITFCAFGLLNRRLVGKRVAYILTIVFQSEGEYWFLLPAGWYYGTKCSYPSEE